MRSENHAHYINQKEMKTNTPTYIIKPKYIFKTPFMKYDLQNPTNREAQNEELTEYFNYGFNEDTMNIYVKLVNRTLKVLDHKKNLEYFDEPSELMRLNDEIPMDFGGFCKFYDPSVFKNDFIQNDQQLLKNFLFNIVKATWINGKQYPTYPMLEFVKSMYPPKNTQKDPEQNNIDFQDNPLPCMIGQVAKNLQAKYEQTMRKLIEQKNIPKQTHPSSLPFKKGGKFEKKPRYDEQKPKQKTEEKKQKKQRNQRSSSSSSSGSSSDSSSSQSEDDRKKRHRDRRDSKKESHRKNKRSRSKDKKDKKQKSDPRQGSRHDDKERSKKISKSSRQRSRSRDYNRSRR